jgi:hypothetical protein
MDCAPSNVACCKIVYRASAIVTATIADTTRTMFLPIVRAISTNRDYPFNVSSLRHIIDITIEFLTVASI